MGATTTEELFNVKLNNLWTYNLSKKFITDFISTKLKRKKNISKQFEQIYRSLTSNWNYIKIETRISIEKCYQKKRRKLVNTLKFNINYKIHKIYNGLPVVTGLVMAGVPISLWFGDSADILNYCSLSKVSTFDFVFFLDFGVPVY